MISVSQSPSEGEWEQNQWSRSITFPPLISHAFFHFLSFYLQFFFSLTTSSIMASTFIWFPFLSQLMTWKIKSWSHCGTDFSSTWENFSKKVGSLIPIPQIWCWLFPTSYFAEEHTRKEACWRYDKMLRFCFWRNGFSRLTRHWPEKIMKCRKDL